MALKVTSYISNVFNKQVITIELALLYSMEHLLSRNLRDSSRLLENKRKIYSHILHQILCVFTNMGYECV